MILRAFFGIFLLSFVVVFDQSVVTFFPRPFNTFQTVLLVGVLIFHFVRPSIGLLWLVGGGIFLDVLGLPGVPYTLAYGIAGITGVFLAERVFTNRSIYAMIGQGIVLFFISFVVMVIWHATFQTTIGFNTENPSIFTLGVSQFLVFFAVLFFAFFMSRRIEVLLRAVFLVRDRR